MKKFLALTLLSASALLLAVPAAQSYSPYLDQLLFEYQQPFSCNVCHFQRKLTPFGADFRTIVRVQPHLRKAFRALDGLDSDKDGWSNKEELKAGCFPHEGVSYPNPASGNQNCLIVSH